MSRSVRLLALPVVALAAFVGHATLDARRAVATTHAPIDAPETDAPRPAGPPAPPIRETDDGSVPSAPRAAEDVERLTTAARADHPMALDPADAWARLVRQAEGTYITDVLRERRAAVARWGDRRAEPIRLWIADGSALDGWQPSDTELVRDAFDEWSAAGLPVRFVVVRDSASADVRVRWVRRFEEPINGRTVWTRDEQYWIHAADVELALEHRDGTRVDSAQLRAIALHEAGHVLGLDHTAQTEQIMAPQVRARALTDADRATARLLYSVPAGRVAMP